MIKFENVTATYTEKIGIFNMTSHVPKGELIFLMGPTGAGKSTVLRTIYKDVPIVDGSLYINGEDVGNIRRRHVPHFRRKIGMVFQDYRLIADCTVFENIALPLQIQGETKKLIKDKDAQEKTSGGRRETQKKPGKPRATRRKIGRASCRERV